MSKIMRTWRVSFTYKGMKDGEQPKEAIVKATSRAEAQRTRFIDGYNVDEVVSCNEV